jgi:DNA-binding CsgD family transcriptional regulator
VYGIQMFGIRREQGRLAELAPAVRALAVSDRAESWRPGLAALMAELGMVREAGAELDRIRAEGLDRLRPSLWLASLTYLADVSAIIGDAAMAELVYAGLLPHFREQRDGRPRRRLLRRGRSLPRHPRSHVRRSRPPREVEILRLVARGLSNREVGRVLSISEHTAANHIRSILRKTGAANRTEAAAHAHTNGLLGAG